MAAPMDPFERLNPSHRTAVEYGTTGLPRELPGPLLIVDVRGPD